MPRILFCLFAVVLCTSDVLRAQSEPGDTAALEQELRRVNALLVQAEQQRDTMAMLQLIAPDFVWVSFSGGAFGRAGRVSAVARGVRTLATAEVSESRAQWVTPDVAMLITTQRQPLGRGAERQLREVRITRLYRRRSDSWELVGQFGTQVAERMP